MRKEDNYDAKKEHGSWITLKAVLKYNSLNSFPSWENVQNKANSSPWPADNFIKPSDFWSLRSKKQNTFMGGQGGAKFAKEGGGR